MEQTVDGLLISPHDGRAVVQMTSDLHDEVRQTLAALRHAKIEVTDLSTNKVMLREDLSRHVIFMRDDYTRIYPPPAIVAAIHERVKSK